jgi:hypothetical protein
MARSFENDGVAHASQDGIEHHKKSRWIGQQQCGGRIKTKPACQSLWDSYNAGAGALSNSYGLRHYVPHVSRGALRMLDLVMLAIGFAFFAISIGYVYACDRL